MFLLSQSWSSSLFVVNGLSVFSVGVMQLPWLTGEEAEMACPAAPPVSVTQQELPPHWRGALMPSQTCVGLHKVKMCKNSSTGQKARGTQPSTDDPGRKENLATVVVCELVCCHIFITGLEWYWQMESGKVSDFELHYTVLVRKVLPLFLCETRHKCGITFFLNVEIRTQSS